jgi:hypothetical protein
MFAICDALGGLSDHGDCHLCCITVCSFCWWDRVHRKSRGNGRAQYACEDCWDTDFGTLRRATPNNVVTPEIPHGPWKGAQRQGAFCQCGPVMLCLDRTDGIEPQPIYIYRESNSIVRSNVDYPLDTWNINHRVYYDNSPPEFECRGCCVLLGTRVRHTTNFFCHFCNLPTRMRSADHPRERQSKTNGAFRDDENYETNRKGADYESVEEHWKQIWCAAVEVHFNHLHPCSRNGSPSNSHGSASTTPISFPWRNAKA